MTTDAVRRDVHARRTAAQRLTGPAASGPEQVVGELLAVQAQDAPLARLGIALRAGGHVGDVGAAVDAGRLVRTHVLRPTWHYVRADDLPWLLELTSPRVLSGLASRHRQLGLDPPLVARGLDAIAAELGSGPQTRRALQARLVERGVLTVDPLVGQRMAHLLLLAELDGLIASGRSVGQEHAYRLWGVPAPGRDREAAIVELTRRFFAHHGPASVGDLMRWVRLNRGEITRAIAQLGDALGFLAADGVRLYFAPDAPPPDPLPRAHVLSTFDEAFLSYRDVPWLRARGHPLGNTPYRWSEAGGGPVLVDLADAGTWRRAERPGRLGVRLELATGLMASGRREVASALRRVIAALAAPGAEVSVEEGGVPFDVRTS
jgi:hypothetical protein